MEITQPSTKVDGHIVGTHAEFQQRVARSLNIQDPSKVVFFFRTNWLKTDFRILSINFGSPDGTIFSSTFHDERYHSLMNQDVRPPSPSQSLESQHRSSLPLPSSATRHTGVGILESVICKYGDTEKDYCKVLFRYTKHGLERFSREHLFDGYQDYIDSTSWYENPIQGQHLGGPPLDEVFPGLKGGDLFLNWVEFPVRCQVWRYREVQRVPSLPFREPGWESLPLGFQDTDTKRILVLIKGGNIPAFVNETTYNNLYSNTTTLASCK